MYLVELADSRWRVHNPHFSVPINKLYNVSSNESGAAPTDSLAASLRTFVLTDATDRSSVNDALPHSNSLGVRDAGRFGDSTGRLDGLRCPGIAWIRFWKKRATFSPVRTLPARGSVRLNRHV